MRKWKKSLYDFFGLEPSPSVNTSYAGSECGDEMDTETMQAPAKEDQNTTSKLLDEVKIQVHIPVPTRSP